MLSELLTSSYLQYKEDTNAVASWLASTAKRCGYAVDQLTQTRKEKPSGRLKGKARKQAKSQKGPATPTYTIAIKDFVSLAEWIAHDHRQPIHVPSSFVTALERAIHTRRRHGDYLAHKSKSAEDSHAYFIGILEHVRETLRPQFPRESLGAGDDDSKKIKINRFEGLEVQEPSKDFLQMRDLPTAVPTSSLGSEANYQAEQMKDLDEAFTAFSLLLDDYHTFRSLIHRTWAGHRKGQYDLVAASLMTNTALDLARRLEDDAKLLFDQFGGPKQMLTAMYLALCSEKGEDQAFREHPGDDMNFRMWEAFFGIFWPVYQLLQSFVLMVDAQHVPQYKPCFYGQYDSTSDWTKMTAREKFTEDKIILIEHLGEFALLCMRVLKMVAEDELTRGIHIAFRTNKIPLVLTFATQVYLDIHHILRKDITRGYTDLETTARQVSNSIELDFKRHKSLRVETWPPSNDLLFKNIQQTIDYWVRYDPLIKAKEKLNRPLSKPFKLWRSYPLFCGLITYHIKIKFEEASVAFVNA
ncbi:hypothetical protein AFCA_006829 [Aspergillus flavus]|uniref:DUF6604 domain-containing protein n=1 Tax=Aspergillus flavus TaxID=5059 RepID=A0AB74C785_ASPFL|nr:hypothetical protein CA14_010565 [Aspergillus flavus]UDD59409.1 hypothetical protein AFCA_006829 [Aspergillus flavus]